MTTASGSSSTMKNQKPLGANSMAVHPQRARSGFTAEAVIAVVMSPTPSLSYRVHQADLKRAMISARAGLVSVAAAPNSSGANNSAAGYMMGLFWMSGGRRSIT